MLTNTELTRRFDQADRVVADMTTAHRQDELSPAHARRLRRQRRESRALRGPDGWSLRTW